MKNLVFVTVMMFVAAANADLGQFINACPETQVPIKICTVEDSSYKVMCASTGKFHCPVYKNVRLTVYNPQGQTIFDRIIVSKVEEEQAYQILNSANCN